MTEKQEKAWDTDDIDHDIREKQELIEQIKEVSETMKGEEAIREVNALRRKWRSIHYWESSFEEELENEFEKYADIVYASRNEARGEAKEKKEALIARAEEVSKTDNFKNGLAEMDTLMEEWKAAGQAGKPTDDELWARFRAARDVFYTRRRQNQKEMFERFKEVKAIKEGLIEEAKALQEPTNWNQATAKMNDIMDRWKAAGSAGRENEARLWNEFSALRKQFNANKSAYFDKVREQQRLNLKEKKGIAREAKEILDSGDLSRSNIDKMKNLSVEWKKIGFAGKEEDAVWKDYRASADAFFDNLKEERDKKHQDWVDRMEDNKAYKLDLIDDQKRRIRRLEDELNGLISQGRAESIEDEIADKEDFIRRLESEIADIDKKLAE